MLLVTNDIWVRNLRHILSSEFHIRPNQLSVINAPREIETENFEEK
jgi:hypothetical protein